MLDRILFENEELLVSVSLLGTYKVRDKNRMITIKASREEGRHFLRVVECLADLGVPITPDSQIFKSAVEGFADSIFCRGLARWRVYFSTPPHEIAGMYAPQSS